MSKYEKLIYFFNDEYKKFLKTYFMRFEIEDLKLYLRTFISRDDISKIKKFMVVSGVYGVLDYDKLSKSTSLEDFIDNLNGTEYHRILKYYLNENPLKMMFYMEMGLDQYYFKKMYKSSLTLYKEDREILIESLGKNSDIQNLQWIYRGLKYYKLSPEELLNYTFSTGYYIKYKQLKELCYTLDTDELLAKIQKTKYGDLFKENNNSEVFFELEMEKYLFRLMISIQRNHPMSIIDSIVYMHKKEFEMRDLFTLLEAKRYGISTDEISKFLIHNIGTQIFRNRRLNYGY
eukprot:TRINITY_DN9157_c0_g1_i1.p1 TRINITY_DN9157_c0_g1~~TRINITY_DN9157_c0_g1_i1.p1  ORF type:complete len:289 (+),score=30.78 TRINITY_DN9157_c0_g1_i1:423-1289(+)